MAQRNTLDAVGLAPSVEPSESYAAVAIFALAAAVPGFAGMWLISAPLSLPAFSAVWLTNAVCAAFLAWCLRAERQTEHVNLWDVAGAYAFIAFAAGMNSKPDQVLQLVGLEMPVQ
jgi:hypothetical protein